MQTELESGKIKCPRCGLEIEIPTKTKRWIVRLYEEATGYVLLPETARRLQTKELMRQHREVSGDADRA